MRKKAINFLQSWKNGVLGLQHLLALFGATTLVPLLTGMSIPVALFAAGIGTWLFHLVTKRKVPIFLGSSFAFIPGIIAVGSSEGLEYARGAIFIAGFVYFVFALVVYKLGVEKIQNIFPPFITGTMIAMIGFSLVPTALGMFSDFPFIGVITFSTALIMIFLVKGFLNQLSILISIVVGYIVSILFNIVDFSVVANAGSISVPPFALPAFSITSILVIVPIVIATFMEHIGDIATNQAVTGQNYFEDPGLHRTLLGDGIATAVSGLIGGPANTTYSENTAILKITKNYDPKVIRIAATFAILISFSDKINAILQSIPTPVLGGVSLMLFLLIFNTGLGILIETSKKIDSWKIVIIGVMLFLGLGNMILVPLTGTSIALNITPSVQLSGVGLAALVAVVLNLAGEKVKKNKEGVN